MVMASGLFLGHPHTGVENDSTIVCLGHLAQKRVQQIGIASQSLCTHAFVEAHRRYSLRILVVRGRLLDCTNILPHET